MKNNVFLALVELKDSHSQVKRVEPSTFVPVPPEARVKVKDLSWQINERFQKLRVEGQIG